MQILIIGGTGFISSYLLHILVERGHQVTIINRGKSRPVLPVPKGTRIQTGDRRRKSDLESVVRHRHFDIVYDMVAYHAEESRLAAEVFRNKVGRFIHCSTVSVYMVSDNVRCPITEDQDQGHLMSYFPRNPFGMEYGIQKRGCENVLWQAHDEKNFPVTVLRPTYISGIGDPMIRDFFWIERILDGGPLLVPGCGDFAFQQVYVEDVAGAFTALSENPQTIGRAYNVASEEIFTLNEYLLELGRLLNRQPELIHVEQSVFDDLAFSTSPDGDVFPFNTRRTAIFSLDKIKQDLGYGSTPFINWMPSVIDYYTNEFNSSSHGYSDRILELSFIQSWCKYRESNRYRITNE